MSKAVVLPAGALSRRRPGDVVILLYHRVGAGRGEISLPVEAFEQQLAHLAARERVLTLDQALAGGPGGGVVLSFDDGYGDFHQHVLPALVRHRLPGLLYLTTGPVTDGTGPGEALSWSQLADAVETGLVTVGAHTHGHTDLSAVPEGVIEDELRRSKELIEDRLAVPCRHFAYPWAVVSTTAEAVVRSTFESAASRAWRTNRLDRIDPYRLGRTPILRSDGRLFFRAKLGGLLDAEGALYRALGRGGPPRQPAQQHRQGHRGGG